MTVTAHAYLQFLLTLPEKDRLTVADFLYESVLLKKSSDAPALSTQTVAATFLARHPDIFAQADTQTMQSLIELAARR